jgi:hypothetical protein
LPKALCLIHLCSPLPWHDAVLLNPCSHGPRGSAPRLQAPPRSRPWGMIFQISSNDPAAVSFMRLKAVDDNGKNENLGKSFGIELASFRERFW